MNVSKNEYTDLRRMVEHIIENDFTNLEFEAIIKSKSASTKRYIDKNSFENVIKRLKNLGLTLVKHPPYLDIFYKENYRDKFQEPIRVTLNGRNNIMRYCNTNSLNNIENITFTEKKRSDILPIELDDYNNSLRFNLKKEIISSNTDGHNRYIISNWSNVYKFFRYKQRFSFRTDTLSIDLTIVKSSDYRNKKPFFTKLFLESNVLTNNPKYEIEIEFIGNGESYGVSSFADEVERKEQLVTRILRDMFLHIGTIFQALEGSNFIVSKTMRESALASYTMLFNHRFFKAPLSVTLEKEHIVKLNDYNNTLTDPPTLITNIRKGYTVTDKADGERNLLIIVPGDDDTSNIYLLNRQNDVKFMGATTSNKYSQTIIDGELITKDINNNTIQLFMAFDIYFDKNTNLLKSHLPDRLKSLTTIVGELNKGEPSNP